MDRNIAKIHNGLQVDGKEYTINSVALTVLFKNGNGDIVLASGLTVPTAGSAGFAKGCQFVKTDAGAGVKATYENQGTNLVSDFNLMGEATAGEIALANGKILVGGADGKGGAVNMSGDATITNAGVVAIGAKKVTGAKLATGVMFSGVSKDTNNTTPVDVFGVANGFDGVITGVFVISKDATAGNIIIKTTAGTVATIAKGGVAGVMTGAVSLANTAIDDEGICTIESSSAGEATVIILFTVA